MDQRRKELKNQYRARKVIGGIYRIRNTETGRFYLGASDDLQGTRNWYSLCDSSGNCPLPAMQADWRQYGRDAFALEELDRLEKGEEQSAAEFTADLKVLRELWSDKLPAEGRY